VQDCAPSWRGEGDLRKSEAQAAAGMIWRLEIRKPKFENRNLGFEIRDLEFETGGAAAICR
jgi:hypothetical protein